MKNHYHHLSTTDRVTLMLMMRQGASLRAVARELKCSPSTLSRELHLELATAHLRTIIILRC
ncbi:helix-turn-helix domain-containing protein [Marinobacter sp. ANT_B65]|uniref:helix-turn-helix domain-containing protein n=1 Tax=Marinobacter sp. ANT_B65 TaxID=2039467 RepID=UPI000BBF2D48|nr:helix-turn-helix domain-containing protein [Marinobacter sp. ANT_B65]PCM45857.1 hypothetical protein CPA50_07810 [Marinobacter sp. ANT_B65]